MAACGPKPRSIEDRFWPKVDLRGPDECWPWKAATNSTGYGFINSGGQMSTAHRVAWELVSGPIPAGMMVDHVCLNRLCVNPAHLRLATNKQNMEHRSGAQSNNRSSGVRGVYPNHDRWMAKVKHHGQQYYLGTFDTIAEAEAAATAKRQELFTHYIESATGRMF